MHGISFCDFPGFPVLVGTLFKSHLKDWGSQGSNMGSLVYKASSLSTTPQPLPHFSFYELLSSCSVELSMKHGIETR